jgi:hypothetical protein
MSFKQSHITQIALTTGGTTTLPNGSVPTPPLFANIDTCTKYLIGGTETLTSNFIVAMTSPADNTLIEIYWRARCTPGAFTVTILGQVIPADLLDKDFTMKLIANGGSFSLLELNLDLTKGSQLPADRLVNASVNTAQMTDKAITYAKIQDVAAHSVPVRASGTSGVLANLAMAANSIIARVAGDIVNLAAATNGHVLKMTAGALGFAQLNFNELAGTIANAQIPDREVALAKMNSTGMLASLTSDVGTTAVTSEEVLFSYTIPAGLIANNGEGISIVVAGTTAANAHTKTIKVKIGGNVYAVNSVTTAPNDKNWFAQVKVLRGGATAAIGEGSLVVDNAHEGVELNATGLTWANALDVEVTGQNGTATINDIVASLVSVQLLR